MSSMWNTDMIKCDDVAKCDVSEPSIKVSLFTCFFILQAFSILHKLF